MECLRWSQNTLWRQIKELNKYDEWEAAVVRIKKEKHLLKENVLGLNLKCICILCTKQDKLKITKYKKYFKIPSSKEIIPQTKKIGIPFWEPHIVFLKALVMNLH